MVSSCCVALSQSKLHSHDAEHMALRDMVGRACSCRGISDDPVTSMVKGFPFPGRDLQHGPRSMFLPFRFLLSACHGLVAGRVDDRRAMGPAPSPPGGSSRDAVPGWLPRGSYARSAYLRGATVPLLCARLGTMLPLLGLAVYRVGACSLGGGVAVGAVGDATGAAAGVVGGGVRAAPLPGSWGRAGARSIGRCGRAVAYGTALPRPPPSDHAPYSIAPNSARPTWPAASCGFRTPPATPLCLLRGAGCSTLLRAISFQAKSFGVTAKQATMLRMGGGQGGPQNAWPALVYSLATGTSGGSCAPPGRRAPAPRGIFCSTHPTSRAVSVGVTAVHAGRGGRGAPHKARQWSPACASDAWAVELVPNSGRHTGGSDPTHARAWSEPRPWTPTPFTGRRIGEADNPGPPDLVDVETRRQRTMHALAQMCLVPAGAALGGEDALSDATPFASPRASPAVSPHAAPEADVDGAAAPTPAGDVTPDFLPAAPPMQHDDVPATVGMPSSPAWQAAGPPRRAPPGERQSWLYAPLLHEAAGFLTADASEAWRRHEQAGPRWTELVATLQHAQPASPRALARLLHAIADLDAAEAGAQVSSRDASLASALLSLPDAPLPLAAALVLCGC